MEIMFPSRKPADAPGREIDTALPSPSGSIRTRSLLSSGQAVNLMDKKEQIKRLMDARQACLERLRIYYNKSLHSETEPDHCPVVWDNVLCWDEAPPGTVQTQSCPDYIHGFHTYHNATRVCTENGTWYFNPATNTKWTNYSDCYDNALTTTNFKDIGEFAAHAGSLHLLYTVGYGISLGSLLIAVFIMCCCRRLKSKSNTLHVNLFLAFILRAVLSFTKEALFVQHLGFEKDIRRRSDGTLEFIKEGTHWECRALVSLFVYSICVSQMWIFVEGLYLHMLIYRTLSTERRGVRIYVLIGWLSPFLFFIPWVIAKITMDNAYCWTISLNPDLFWIISGPLMGAVILNSVFFLNILRVLVTRVRSADRHSSRQQQYRRLAKFILVLVPLFGILYIVFYVVFPMTFSRVDVTHLYIEMAYNSFQGFILALLFCFLNEEVHAEIRRIWMRKKSLRRDSMALTRSFALSSLRKPSNRNRTGACGGGPNSVVRCGRSPITTTNNNHHPHPQDSMRASGSRLYEGRNHAVRVTRAGGYSTNSSPTTSGSKSDDWLVRLKQRAALVVFWRKKSSESREGVIDTRYDCDGVPDIDADTSFVCNGDTRILDCEDEAGDRGHCGGHASGSDVERHSSEGSGNMGYPKG